MTKTTTNKTEKAPESGQEEKALTKTDDKAMAPVPVGHGGVQITSLESLWRFSQYVAVSGFAPKGMERPESCLIAIEMGLEVGLQPMQAIQNIAVINGRPSVWGDAAKALVEASGLCVDFAEWFEGTEGKDDYRAICEVKRAGRSRPVRWEFSIADAKRAMLWGKAGPWTQYPKRMLQMRARGFAIRDGFPDVMRGLALAEESQDYIDVKADPAPSGIDALTEKMEAKQAAEPTPEPDPEPQEDAPEVDEETGEIVEGENPESTPEPANVGTGGNGKPTHEVDEDSLF
jgi:hypothetical protein